MRVRRVTFALSEELHLALKSAAYAKKITMQEALEEAIIVYVGFNEERIAEVEKPTTPKKLVKPS